jgi:hypothetical protein
MADSNINLSDAIAESYDKIEDSEKQVNNSESQEVETSETVETPKEVNSDQSEEVEAFAEKVDTKGKTPEELEEIYQNWNKSYTQKRQKEREELRQLQSRIQELEKLQGQSLNTSQVKSVSKDIESPDLQSQQAEAAKQFNLGNMSVEEYTRYVTQLAQEEARRATEDIISAREDEKYQESALAEFNQLDDRFNVKYTNPDSPEYNETYSWMYSQVTQQMADALEAYQKENGTSVGFPTKEVAKEAILRFDKYVDSLVKTRVQQSNQVAKTKSLSYAKARPSGTSTSSRPQGKTDLRSLINESFN